MRADALLLAVLHGPHVYRVLQVPVDALDLEELLVTKHHVPHAQVRVAAADQVLTVQLRFGRDLALIDLDDPVLLFGLVKLFVCRSWVMS